MDWDFVKTMGAFIAVLFFLIFMLIFSIDRFVARPYDEIQHKYMIEMMSKSR